MSRLLLSLLLALSLLPLGACAPRGLELTVLHTNDIHAAYGGLTAEGKPCYAALCPGGQGGTARLDREVTALRATNDNVLLLDAGDQFIGTLFHARYVGKTTEAVLDFLAYDATVPGNHEFDHGCEVFSAHVQAMKTPMLAANIRLPNQSLQSLPPWRIVERDGVRIGLIGLTTQETVSIASPCPEARFLDEAAALRVAVAELQAQGVKHIVLISHVGLQRDKALAASVDGVDVIVGGHSHSLLTSQPQEKEGKVDGPYPVQVTSPSGQPVLIVTARHSGTLLGKLHVRFDAEGVPVSWTGEPVRLTGDEGVRPEAVALIESFAEPLKEWTGSPAGTVQAAGIADGRVLDLPDVYICRKQECLSGNVLTDVLRAVPGMDGKPTQIVLINAGAMRQSLPAGPVSVGDLFATLPYGNMLVTADLPGSVVLEALEQGLSGWQDGAGRFLQVSGLRYVADPQKPVGQRLVSASLRTPAGLVPLDPRKVYRVATFDYAAGGGDGFTMLKGHPWQRVGLDVELIASVLRTTPATARLDSRIVLR